jgi:hypothetical protein
MTLSAMKEWPYSRSGLSQGRKFNSIFTIFVASEIWPDKRHGLWWELSYKRGITVLKKKYSLIN